MLTRPGRKARAIVLVSLMAAACSGGPPSVPPGSDPAIPQPSVAALWIAEDGSVVAINLVVPVGIEPARIREIAEESHEARPGARVIVRVFTAAAGPERFILGHVPTLGEPLSEASPPRSLIAVYDFPP